MRFLTTLFRNLWRQRAVERDLDEEGRAHFELLVDEYRATGMEDTAARRAARLELGGDRQVNDAVNQTMARQRWPDESAIGRRVRMPDYIKPPNPYRLAAPGSDGWFEIVGVVGDTPNVGLHEPPAPSIYVPYMLMLSDSLNVILRTSANPLAMSRSIREAVRTVDPNQPVSVYTAEGALARAGWARERFVTLLLLGFAMFALMLAVVGLYSVVSYSVSCRFKEFGIRMALGAGRGRIVNAAVQPAVLAIVAGLFAGLASSVGLNKVVAQWSLGNLNDPVVLVAVSLVLFIAAVMSAAIPANRLPRFSRSTRFGSTDKGQPRRSSGAPVECAKGSVSTIARSEPLVFG